MIISHKHKFIFIHVHKVAGTSVTHALRPYTCWPQETIVTKIRQRMSSLPVDLPGRLPTGHHFSDHVTAAQLKTAIAPNLYNQYYKFAFVRNPWDWQVSLYKYILKNKHHAKHDYVKQMSGFEEYLGWRFSEPKHKPWSLQKNYLTGSNGELIVDFVGRYEQLQTDFQRVLAHLKIKAQLPHLNKSRADDYRTYYSPRLSAQLFEYYQDDIEMFGYRPPVLLAS